jgi:hypothetical protein
VRGVFFDEDDARAVLAALHRGGWDAVLVRERLAGEDDDEDHPWAVVTDAPAPVLDVLMDTHDGWLDHEEPDPGPALPPLRLPRAPRRPGRPAGED